MKNKYIDLIEQTADFPTEEFKVVDNELYFNDIPLMDIIEQYGTPLRITYLPRIASQIQKARRMFNVAMAKVDYNADYHYCYCTKSSHFSFVMEEALKNGVNVETMFSGDQGERFLGVRTKFFHRSRLTGIVPRGITKKVT